VTRTVVDLTVLEQALTASANKVGLVGVANRWPDATRTAGWRQQAPPEAVVLALLDLVDRQAELLNEERAETHRLTGALDQYLDGARALVALADAAPAPTLFATGS
jgi:hypothetical protein